jgi:hypothetical protein
MQTSSNECKQCKSALHQAKNTKQADITEQQIKKAANDVRYNYHI